MADINTGTDSKGDGTAAAGGDYPPIIDAAQVADLLGMNVQMVRKYAREGRIPAYRLPGGRAFKFFRDEIFEFLRGHPVEVEVDADASTSTI